MKCVGTGIIFYEQPRDSATEQGATLHIFNTPNLRGFLNTAALSAIVFTLVGSITPTTNRPNKSSAANQQRRETDRVATTTTTGVLLGAVVPAARPHAFTTAKGV
jgi:hypothetical protein